jgi:hypothetical protein
MNGLFMTSASPWPLVVVLSRLHEAPWRASSTVLSRFQLRLDGVLGHSATPPTA